MSITDELREYALGWDEGNRVRRDLTAIADRIDAEHEKATSGCIHYDPERHYCAVHGDTENGWVRLPVDADGVPIHAGDVLTDGEYTFRVDELAAFGDGSWSIRNEDGNAWAACDVTHHHEPTVEDVLRAFWSDVDLERADGCGDFSPIIAEYAAKLRLAGDAE